MGKGLDEQPEQLLAVPGTDATKAPCLRSPGTLRGLHRAEVCARGDPSGYSAGPCMLGPTLRGIESEEDDPAFVP